MQEAALPNAKAINASVSKILTLTGGGTALAVLLFLQPVIRFTPDQVRLACIVGGVAAILFTLIGNLQQRPRMRADVFESDDELGNLGRSVDMMSQSLSGMEAINEAALASGERSSRIVAAVREQSKAAATMASLMEQIDRDIEGIRTRATAQSEDARLAVGSSGEMSTVAHQPQLLTTRLSESTEQISRSMNWVHGTSSEIDGSLQNQMLACELAQSALAGVQVQVDSNEGSVNKVDEVMTLLAQGTEELRAEVAHVKLGSETAAIDQ
jgi:methyl-accepting chemotaxis protein